MENTVKNTTEKKIHSVAVIGFGTRMKTFVGALLATGRVRICAIADPDGTGARERAAACGVTDARIYPDAREMLETETPDGVLVGTRCSLHTEMAELVASYGLPLFLEKPVAITDGELARLEKLLPTMEEKTVVSFPLRASYMYRRVEEILRSGVLGKLSQIQAVNNVPYGRGYFHKWYRHFSETGGQLLQKSTHDLDYINHLLAGDRPLRVMASRSRTVFGGDEPAEKKCADCDKRAECRESPENLQDFYATVPAGEYCCFARDVDIEDCDSCIVEYESGIHAVYTQNFVVRRDAGKRGARIVGFLGTLEFDWVSGIITVYHHFENKVETVDVNAEQTGSHFGGDEVLAESFVGVMEGKASVAPLSSGVESARLCLAARRSATEHCTVAL